MRKVSLRILCRVLLGFHNRKGNARTMVKKNRMLAISTLAILLLSLSGSVWARDLPRGGVGQPGFSGGVLEQLIHPCRATCRDTARDCSDAAESDAVTCAQNTCAQEIVTAQSACAVDRTTQACKDAVSSLRTCGAACLTTLRSAVTSCRETLSDCVDACDIQ